MNEKNNNTINDINDNNIKISISKNKYPILNKISNEHLEYVIDEIFELGYSQYMKNLIRTDIQTTLNHELNLTNSITESKYSSLKGSMGENIVFDILIDKFPNCVVENMSKIPHSGDIQIILPIGIKLIVEVKNYNKTIDQEQIDKLKFDMRFNNIRGALFVSLNSGIVGRKKFELEFFKNNTVDCFIIYLPYSMHKSIPDKKNIISHNSIEDSILNLSIKLEFGICIIQNIICRKDTTTIGNLNKFCSSQELDWMTTQFDQLYNEFKTIKNSIRKLDDSIKKSLDSHKSVINEYENFILNKINNLIGTKLYKEEHFNVKKNINLEKNNFGSWDIIIDEQMCGLIVCVYNSYDILINYNKNIINKHFGNFIECLNFVNQL